MQPELIAILSAALFGLAAPLTRRGLEHAPIASAVCFGVLSTTVVLVVSALLVPHPPAPTSALLLLALAGVVGNLLGRVATITGVAALGASLAGPIQGTYPFFAFALALLFLGESLAPLHALGAVLIVGGVAMLTASGRAQPARLMARTLGRRATVFPLLAAFQYAAGDTLIRAALIQMPNPVFGAAFSYTSASVAMGLGFALVPRFRKQVVLTRAAVGWFTLGGAVQGVAVLLFFAALSVGEVVRVSPIIGAIPLFVLIWSVVLLRRLEVLRRSTVLGAVTVALGVAILSLARSV